jgi:hypothetical protein
MNIDLLEYKKNIFSQNGEDGIIEKIFDLIGTRNKVCCEFGAWDGIHFCNIRNLIINKGWHGVLIEGDKKRCSNIEDNYRGYDIYTINSFVDTINNKLSNILQKYTNIRDMNIDFLSIDIDGLDYEIFETLDILPNVICIEVNAGHHPNNHNRIEKNIAKYNIGQPLKVFSDIAKNKGYSLACYSGNAFYIRDSLFANGKLEPINDEKAYCDFLNHLTKKEKEWLFLVNIGNVPPYYKYENSFLNKDNLNYTYIRQLKIIYQNIFKNMIKSIVSSIKQLLRV